MSFLTYCRVGACSRRLYVDLRNVYPLMRSVLLLQVTQGFQLIIKHKEILMCEQFCKGSIRDLERFVQKNTNKLMSPFSLILAIEKAPDFLHLYCSYYAVVNGSPASAPFI